MPAALLGVTAQARLNVIYLQLEAWGHRILEPSALLALMMIPLQCCFPSKVPAMVRQHSMSTFVLAPPSLLPSEWTRTPPACTRITFEGTELTPTEAVVGH